MLLTRASMSAIPAAVVLVAVVLLGGAGASHAQRPSTAEGLTRLGDALRPAVEEGPLAGMIPVIVVGARPAYEETRAWFPAATISTLSEAFGTGNLRACEACLSPRVHVAGGRLEHVAVDLSVDEVVAYDAQVRGHGPPARAAAWVEETPLGVSARIVSLETNAILFAGNFDGSFTARKRTARTFTLSEEVDRRLRGDTLTHVLFDAALFPGLHFSADVVDQLGDRNLDMAGVSFSLFDPVIGVGVAYHRVIPEALHLSIGGKALVSAPTALASSLSEDVGELLDPLLTGVLVVRWPIPNTAYALLLTASTNGQVGLGLTLMNFGFLPVLP